MVQFLQIYLEAHFDEHKSIGRNANLFLALDIFLFIKTTTPYTLSTSFTIITSALTTG